MLQLKQSQIDTNEKLIKLRISTPIYILLSIKTRIETNCEIWFAFPNVLIYILLSIKTRIETSDRQNKVSGQFVFISYYPLKQGLKRSKFHLTSPATPRFISYYPLKQGLKRILHWCFHNGNGIYILLSIKTRIETLSWRRISRQY